MLHDNKMPFTQYGRELQNLTATYSAAMGADVSRLKAAIAGACESSVIGVGVDAR